MICNKATVVQHGKGKANACTNRVSRPCQVCGVNQVDVECFKQDIRCGKEVHLKLPCGHQCKWKCDIQTDPRTQACTLCHVPLWRAYINQLKLQCDILGMEDHFALLREKTGKQIEGLLNITSIQQLPSTAETLCNARMHIAQKILDNLRQHPEKFTAEVPPPQLFLSDEDLESSCYHLVFCDVPAAAAGNGIEKSIRQRFQQSTKTRFGLGIQLSPLNRTALSKVLQGSSSNISANAWNLCIGVLYTNKSLVTDKPFAVGRGNNRKQDPIRVNQTHRANGYDSVEYRATTAAEPTQWVTWEIGTAVPLMLVSASQRYECCICMEKGCNGDGLLCPGKGALVCGFFTCWDCLQESFTAASKPDAIAGTLDSEGILLCANPQCRCPLDVKTLTDARVPGNVIEWQQNLRLQITKDKEVQHALAQQKLQIEAEYARIERIKDEHERAAAKLRQKLIEEVLTLRCPRCFMAFADFDGCFALHCGNNQCRAAFCAWCLSDCGSDAHTHVARCTENKVNGNLYGTEVAFKDHHRTRRAGTLRTRILQAELTMEAKEKLRTLLRKDLNDLGIQETEVF